MQSDTEIAASIAGSALDEAREKIERDTAELLAEPDIPALVVHFDHFRTTVNALAEKVTALQNHVELLSRELLPTIFLNKNVKTINIIDIGRVTINQRWSASMINKPDGLHWLRETGNEGLIIETVSAQTLGAFAKDMALERKPLPDSIFKVGTSNYVSITKA